MTKSIFLAISLVLAASGIHTRHPFLIHCLDESSPLINSTEDITFCDFDNLTKWEDCLQNEKERDHTEKLVKFADVLEELKEMGMNLELETESLNRSHFERQLTAKDIRRIQNGPDRLRQKVRICGNSENVVRIATLTFLIFLIISAAWATFHLHKIADYKVISIISISGSICDNYCFRTSLSFPRTSPAGSRTATCR